ncbi:hypothetical protein SAMN06265338_10795 [Rhodoblastus acidophilus]|uniref:Uncharacterized protein n=1 Tax=Rhodoblastus acidophilus TaxID=1074 RepID=A0A212RTQ3_RHOAC|nr:hypothetical protein [Rhodoblastus acidophilus]PPQ37372.1 hypothetical protein CKO16_14535 [Rhodoblastus acidophilus]RAI23158.1 hypothetical protein CH337_03810 [Rhodoblastus acidophilus]SNB76072.1 hypothetical protein SAMN06265338_10795 [Rhodoblastus acidophilus]
MHFEFRSQIYADASDMHHAIAIAYLLDSGGRDEWDRRAFLASHSAEACADEAIVQWLLDEPAWANPRGFSRVSLIDAYAELLQSGSAA